MKNIIAISIVLFLIGCSEQREFPKIVLLTNLKSTDFGLTDKQEIEPKRNQIYCPTLLFAWNQLKSETHMKLVSENELAHLIDKSRNYINSLTEKEYTNTVSVVDSSIKVKSEFVKSLVFSEEFVRNNIKLRFSDNQDVESFGCFNCNGKTKSQIKVVHYDGNKDFAIKISSKNETSEILLYLPSQPRNTLSQYYNDLRTKISKKRNEKDWWKYRFLKEDRFEVPIIAFNIEAIIEELNGVIFSSDNKTIEIKEVRQRIALVFDEKGAEIESDAEMNSVTTDATDEEIKKPVPKKLIFDKPFLLVFKKKEFDNPYFMAWINNSELMKKKRNY